MTKIFKHLAKHWAACLVIIALLLVQAYGDLTLPDYTSKIVDTGIQQSGIADAVPEVVRDSTLQVLELLMTDADAAAVEAAYTQPGVTDNALSSATSLQKKLTSPNTVRLLRADADRDTLAEVFSTPDIVLYLASAQAAGEGNAPDAAALDTVTAQFAAMTQMPGFSRDAVQAQLAAAMGQAGECELSGLSAQAVLLVGLEYQALGISDAVQMNYLMQPGGRMLGLTLLMVAAAVLVGLLASRVAAAIARDLRRGVFRRVVSFSASETDKFSTASLITRTTNDVQQIQMTCVILLRMVAYAPILGIGGIIHVAQAGSSLTWIIVLAVALLLALITVLMQFAMPKFRIMQKLVDRLNLVSREILTGIMPIRAFSREQHEEARFDAANTDLMRTQLFTNRVMAAMMPFMTLIMNGTSLLIVWFGGKQIDAGTMQVGSMIAFITYTMQIVMSFLMLTMVAVMLPRAGVAADRIDEVLTTEPAIHDPVPEAIPADLNQHHWNGEVAFHHVNFTYPGSSEDALHDIDFVAKPGQTTAIIGSTGCGKTSLLHLITRFYDVTGGEILIDGQDIRHVTLSSLRNAVGVVQQDVYLFSGTVAENIAYGKPGATREEIIAAARLAGADGFVRELKDGYDTYVGERGVKLSGGQKQRISIARVFLKNPPILLLDEATSALDNESEILVGQSLDKLAKGRTTLTIAHRLTTIKNADRILVLGKSGIEEEGRHEELLAKKGIYYRLWNGLVSGQTL